MVSSSYDFAAMMEPVSALQIGRFYDSYSAFIDFFIYLFVFNGIARVSLEKRFEGKAGQFLINGVGVILAIGMALAESAMGFSLKSVGPLAVALLLVVVGVTAFSFLRHVGVGRSLSASLSVLLLYFSLGAMAPSLLDFAFGRVPLLGVVPVVAFVAALWHAGRWLMKGSASRALEAADGLRHSAPVRAVERKIVSQKKDRRELDSAKAVVAELSSREFRQSDDVVRGLEQIEDVLRRFGDNPKVRSFVAAKVREIVPKTHALALEMVRLRELDRDLMRGDYSAYRRLHALSSQMNGDEKAVLDRRVREEAEKIRSEWGSKDSEENVRRHLGDLEYFLRRCAQSLSMGQPRDALQWIRKAIEHEKSAAALLVRIRDAKRKLISLIERESRPGALAAA